MKKRQFNYILKTCLNKKGMLDKTKISALSNDIKKNMCLFISRHKHAIVKEFIPDNDEVKSNLHASGYLYIYTNKAGYTFLGTGEHKQKYENK